MDWSTRRKMGCFSFVGIIIAIVLAYFVYIFFIKTTPTCFDGIQNQDERGIDCGGICTLVCTADAKTIVPIWSRVFNTAGDVHSVVAYVENQNITAGVKKIGYEFRIYDDQNILAGEPISGTTFIGPNDKTAIFASPIKTGNRIPKNVFFKFTTAPEWITTSERYNTPQLNDMTADAYLNVRADKVFDMVLCTVKIKQAISGFGGNSTRYIDAQEKRLTRDILVYDSAMEDAIRNYAMLLGLGHLAHNVKKGRGPEVEHNRKRLEELLKTA
jgi:hypothetical protein